MKETKEASFINFLMAYLSLSSFISVSLLLQWEFVSAFRQAQREKNALAIVNAGMRVVVGEGDGIIKELAISYGGVGPTTICAKNSCQKLIGRYGITSTS